jgi:ubiquinone/menaquinone biosynthesis C-methylase UbiE
MGTPLKVSEACGCGPSCCTPSTGKSDGVVKKPDALIEEVRAGYAAIAEKGVWLGDPSRSSPDACDSAGGCCGGSTISVEVLAKQLGYSVEELRALPEGSNMGLSCGNPTALASLAAGEVVVDLGSGGGFDCFVAGPKVGPSGKVIGVDMTPEMISKARKNTAQYVERTGLSNVEFRLGEIGNLPIADGTADVVISNCVLNLAPDKARVWREIERVLKPGGRVAVSDLALVKPLPPQIMNMMEALVGCVSGAVLIADTAAQMQAAGFVEIKLTSKPTYVDAMTNGEDPLYKRIVEALPSGEKPSDYITSLDIAARKS